MKEFIALDSDIGVTEIEGPDGDLVRVLHVNLNEIKAIEEVNKTNIWIYFSINHYYIVTFKSTLDMSNFLKKSLYGNAP